MIQKKAAVLLSGGIDSTTALARILHDPNCNYSEVVAVVIRYPSKHNIIERAAAHSIADYYSVRVINVDLTSIFSLFDSALLIQSHRPIPEGHYEAETMRDTVVPLRNLIFSTVVAGILMSREPSVNWTLVMGAHVGDHHIYPDCRPETTRALRGMLWEGSDRTMFLSTPFETMDKEMIVSLGLDENAPYHLTRTCYTDDILACGRCGSCNERLEAFAKNRAKDPALYQQQEPPERIDTLFVKGGPL